ncbi:tyrosine--tRNA ligase [Candidatus Micrarchaeota archaeon]|nr:tyrosine--tRNA ligase [Candidatus Micrarchaeota archaeon]MBD3418014.1 tyrosine--tRNA ligase [Candidatus Micrarchaeota archaeon]
MDIEKKIGLVKKTPTQELVTEDGLRSIFESNPHPKHYIGFEISGFAHIGTGLATALKIKDLLEAGCKPTVFLADYHTWINGKLGGDLDKIRAVAEGYFKHCFIALGLPESKVEYVLASTLYDSDYWKTVLDISRTTTLNRMLRCITIMGRKETDTSSSASILYPAMQAADIFMLNVQIAHSGMDQRKVHMLAREIAPKLGFEKPVALHGRLLPSLQGVERMNPTEDQLIDAKMSKSKPDSAIFVHEPKSEILRKIKKAYCPEKVADGNPMIEYAENLILRDRPLQVERPEKFGGDTEYATPKELREAYTSGALHPMDLKNAVGKELVEMLQPVREYFEKHPKYLKELEDIKITR